MEKIIELIKRLNLPPLYAQENESDPILYLRFYLIGFSWTWFACEAKIEDNDVLFYGFVAGDEHEFGYFRLSELCSTDLPLMIDTKYALVIFSELRENSHYDVDD